MRRVSVGAIVDMSTHSSRSLACALPGAPSATPLSAQSTLSTWVPSTTMLTTMSLAAATSAGVSTAVALCSCAQRRALPSVCVHTVSG